jgi:pilus assembly protein CpaF
MWQVIIPPLAPEQRTKIVASVSASLKDVSVADMRNREVVIPKAAALIQSELPRLGIQASSDEIQDMAREIAARVGGLGFLEPLLRLDSGFSEIALNPDGSVWTVPRGEQDFRDLGMRPSEKDTWRAVEALLSDLGRSVSEASPSVDAKLKRSPELPGGARLKILHPVIVPGAGNYPSVNIRLFQPNPVPPEKILEWNMAPQWVVNLLVESVHVGLRVVTIGGTASGKTTLLSALANGIPREARIVKIEDPEEIWLAQPNVVSIEARPAQVGSSVPPYTLANGVDDAMRMSPRWLIVGEMRRGDAINALFRAQMSDHPGLSTFHAEGPEAMVKRMTAMLWADAGVQAAPAKELIVEAIDMVVQVGFRPTEDGAKRRRKIIGVWTVEKELKAGNLVFNELYHLPGDEEGRLDLLERMRAAFRAHHQDTPVMAGD